MNQPFRPTRTLLLGIAISVAVAVWFCWPEPNPFAGVIATPLHVANETAIDDRSEPANRGRPAEQGFTDNIAMVRRRDAIAPSTDTLAEDEIEMEVTVRLPPIDYGFVRAESAGQWTANQFYGADESIGNLTDQATSPEVKGLAASPNMNTPVNDDDSFFDNTVQQAPPTYPLTGRPRDDKITGDLQATAAVDVIAADSISSGPSSHGPTTEIQPAAMTAPLNTEGEGGPSKSTQGTTDYVLAAHPKVGDQYKDETPLIDCGVCEIPAIPEDFSPDPIHSCRPYDPYLNQDIYNSKQLNANQRPLLELGRPWYQLGQLSPGSSLLGSHNNVNPQFLVFGDYRQAFASNTIDGDSSTQLAFELNTFWNLQLTSTERIVWGISPLDDGVRNTRWEFDRDRFEFESDFDFDFGYLEGDLGALAGGVFGQTLPFDAPFAIGLTPVLIQNGIWLNDAVEGAFFTIPARNSPLLDISNMDISFGFIWDNINSDAFFGDNSAAKAYAIYSFIEALNGYIELDYAFLEDRSTLDRSYHNISVAYSRRFGRFLSHSTRVVANAGQQVSSGDQTADGVLLLSENSLITSHPYSVIPYFNCFAGFDTPQSVAGDNELLNTGILFESDGMTGYPTLDIRAQETAGGAVGLNLLAPDFSQQLILEAAAVFKQNDSDLPGDQYGVGMRYQLPLSNSWIFRTDSMYGFFRGDSDNFGMRMELRKKF